MKRAAALLLGLLCFGAHAEEHLDMDVAVQICAEGVNNDCIIRHFKDTIEASEIRGRLVFENYCTLCHGVTGEGDGRAARLHNPPPYNLTLSVVPREYTARIIRKGGEAMGRGVGMPPWGEQLTDEQTNDVLNYLFSIRTVKN